jgi:hypothetical protein
MVEICKFWKCVSLSLSKKDCEMCFQSLLCKYIDKGDANISKVYSCVYIYTPNEKLLSRINISLIQVSQYFFPLNAFVQILQKNFQNVSLCSAYITKKFKRDDDLFITHDHFCEWLWKSLNPN